MKFNLQVAMGSAIPIYRQITEQVRLAVAAGKLAPGDPLPSVRALADELLINVNTAAKAYAELSREGVIITQPGRGVFVAERRRRYTRQEQFRRLEPSLRAFLSEASALGLSAGEVLELVSKEVESWENESAAGNSKKGSNETR